MRATLVAIIFLASACAPGIGACDMGNAMTVAYDHDGIPAYSGQALTIRSCVPCHSPSLTGAARQGAPAGLDFDVRLASTTADLSSAGIVREEQGQVSVARDFVWGAVATGKEPPGPAGQHAIMDPSTPHYYAQVGTSYVELPEITTPEGRDIFRNWLACGSPLVERTIDPTSFTDPTATVGDAGWTVAVAMPPPP